MRKLQVIVLMLIGFYLGCAGSISSVSNPAGPIINQQIVPGDEYEIFVNGSDDKQVSYLGRVAAVASDSITLENVLKRVYLTGSLPIPLVGQLFQTKSVGGELLDGPVTILRGQISEIRDAPAQ